MLRRTIRESCTCLVCSTIYSTSTIESVQTGFPDCTARRDLGDGSAEELRIEFEFKSLSFHRHGHDPLGADVIVCWKHNWEDCPEHLEIIELSTLIGFVPIVEPKTLSTYQHFCQKKRRESFSFSDIATLWNEGEGSQKPQPKKPLSRWQLFCRDKRREGLSLSEIAKFWHEQQKENGKINRLKSPKIGLGVFGKLIRPKPLVL